MASPFWIDAEQRQGRIQPAYGSATDGQWAFVLGQDASLFGDHHLRLGDVSEVIQEVLIPDPAPAFLRFDWRMRTSQLAPQGQVLLTAGTVDFLTTGADPVEGVQLPVDPIPPFTQDMTGRIVRVSGATDGPNNGDWTIAGVPDQAPIAAGRVAILDNPGIVPRTADPGVTLELLGLWWHARCFVDGHLRAELIEPAVQASPEGWQRTDLAAHIGKMAPGNYMTLRFVLSLEPTALS